MRALCQVLWIFSISFSIRLNGGLSKLYNGPSSFSISFMFSMSALFTAPMASSIQLGRDSWDMIVYVARAESMDDERIFAEEL